ncbi:hypothetical protein O0I10_000937 [Lichtheimia ornata]|uniref:Uncharacterized protein n=1 Tax=Lichtheimia ornata TaxID=688661 RepID=A0AAD7Y4K4_9FUNG|nr:uncharacterized protein O0I10_000937 [Lichtheimia ornata]KAJ8663688.1 hypothetical protein O0I10_000937 [Lichtheimia ornata]
MEVRGRMVNKQQVATTTRWVNKSTTEARFSSDDNFCTLTNGVDTGMKSKRATWNDVVSAKRKDVSVGDGNDPFAGMNSLVDYQQEIERLKTLVPKVDKKRVSGSSAAASVTAAKSNNKGMSSLPPQQQQHQQRNMWYDSLPVSTRSKPRSPSVGPSSEPTLSQTSSIASDDEGTLEPEDHGKPTESITEEEKARFLAFMRKWTGGCGWQAWSSNNNHPTSPTTTTTTTTTSTTTTIEPIITTEPTSLWTESAPWECISTKQSHFNNHHHHHHHTNAFFDSYSHQQHHSSYPTHQLSPSFYHHQHQQQHHHQQQQLDQSPYNNHPQPVGAVGQRYQYHGPSSLTSTRTMSNRGPPFGVFVI